MVNPDNVVVAARRNRDAKQEAICQLRSCAEYILEHAEDLVGEMGLTLDPGGLAFVYHNADYQTLVNVVAHLPSLYAKAAPEGG